MSKRVKTPAPETPTDPVSGEQRDARAGAETVDRKESEAPAKRLGFMATSAKAGRALYFPIIAGFEEHVARKDFEKRLAMEPKDWVGTVHEMEPSGRSRLSPIVGPSLDESPPIG